MTPRKSVQIPLWAEGDKAVATKTVVRITRPRVYDRAIIEWVARLRMVTVHQIVYNFFLRAGKGPRNGFRVVHELAKRGFLETHRLDPHCGMRSRLVVSVTPKGYDSFELPKPEDLSRVVDTDDMHYHVQFADMVLQRRVDRWRFISVDNTETLLEAMRLHLLLAHDDPPHDPYAIDIGEWFDNLVFIGSFNLNTDLLANGTNGEVRLILPVRGGQSYQHVLDNIPRTKILTAIEFEIVGVDEELIRRAKASIQRWARKRRITVMVHQADSLRERLHPNQYRR